MNQEAFVFPGLLSIQFELVTNRSRNDHENLESMTPYLTSAQLIARALSRLLYFREPAPAVSLRSHCEPMLTQLDIRFRSSSSCTLYGYPTPGACFIVAGR